jgi:hypothetical protein
LDAWVERLDRAAVVTAESSLRRTGAVMPVTVHVLAERADPSYVGFLVCRRFEPGMDAEVGVASMGVLPAVLDADRVVVCWEHVELAAALEVPGAYALPPGLVVLDARRTGHEVRFHPLRLRPNEDSDDVVDPRWGPVRRVVDGELPRPITRLLRTWRTERGWSPTEVTRAISSLDFAGYALGWISQELAPGPVRR